MSLEHLGVSRKISNVGACTKLPSFEHADNKEQGRFSERSMVIRALDLSKTFTLHGHNHPALSALNLEIREGETVAILGESGAGKSTFMRCLLGLDRPTSGELWLNGTPLHVARPKDISGLRQSMAWVAQDAHLLASQTVLNNVLLPLRLAQEGASVAQSRGLELLRRVGLEDKVQAYPSQLSGGQKQRVAIARALVRNPRILLCDEPTSALDALTTQGILNLLTELHRERGFTLICVTHDERVARTLCRRLITLRGGSVIRDEVLP